MCNMLDKLAEELSTSALARKKVSELAKNEGVQVNLDEFMDGYFESKCTNVDVPNTCFGQDIRLFIGDKNGKKYMIGINSRPTASSIPFMVTHELTTVEKFSDGSYRLNNYGGNLIFHPYNKNKE